MEGTGRTTQGTREPMAGKRTPEAHGDEAHGDEEHGSGVRNAVWRILRIGAALCFIGHGAFGIITKEAWIPYFGLAGISPETAYALMPVVGTVDIAVGIAALVYPTRLVFGYMAVWAVWTAALRPLTGEPVWELLERAGNYGVPLALLLMAGVPGTLRGWWERVGTENLRRRIPRSALVTLQASVVLLVLGHAGYGLEGRELLARHYGVLGWDPISVFVVGGFELGLAAALATALSPLLLVLTAVWKLGTELLYPLAGHPVWEFIERSGSYAAPIALAVILFRARHPAVGRRIAGLRRAIARPGWAAPLAILAAVTLLGATSSSTDSDAPRIVPVAGTISEAAGARSTGVATGAATPGARRGAPAVPPPADTVWNRMSGQTLLRTLRAGEMVLACRHAITDRSRGDARRVDFSDRRTQRNLSTRGERQARELGREIATLEIPIGPVLTSPYARTHESADLTFGRAEVDEALYGSRRRARLRRLFSEPTDGSGNRVLMTHQYILRRMLRVFGPGEIEEGDCVVVRPLGERGYDIAAHLSPGEWGGLR